MGTLTTVILDNETHGYIYGSIGIRFHVSKTASLLYFLLQTLVNKPLDAFTHQNHILDFTCFET